MSATQNKGDMVRISTSQSSNVMLDDGELVWLEDSWGDVSEHRMSAGLTQEVVWVYLNGQCLAMATALATHLGSLTSEYY